MIGILNTNKYNKGLMCLNNKYKTKPIEKLYIKIKLFSIFLKRKKL